MFTNICLLTDRVRTCLSFSRANQEPLHGNETHCQRRQQQHRWDCLVYTSTLNLKACRANFAIKSRKSFRVFWAFLITLFEPSFSISQSKTDNITTPPERCIVAPFFLHPYIPVLFPRFHFSLFFHSFIIFFLSFTSFFIFFPSFFSFFFLFPFYLFLSSALSFIHFLPFFVSFFVPTHAATDGVSSGKPLLRPFDNCI